MSSEDVTLGELGRRIQGLKNDIRDVTLTLGALDQKLVSKEVYNLAFTEIGRRVQTLENRASAIESSMEQEQRRTLEWHRSSTMQWILALSVAILAPILTLVVTRAFGGG